MKTYDRVRSGSLADGVHELVMRGLAYLSHEPGITISTSGEIAKTCYIQPDQLDDIFKALFGIGELVYQQRYQQQTKQSWCVCFIATGYKPAIVFHILYTWFAYPLAEATAITRSLFLSQANHRRRDQVKEAMQRLRLSEEQFAKCTDELIYDLSQLEKNAINQNLQQILSQAKTIAQVLQPRLPLVTNG